MDNHTYNPTFDKAPYQLFARPSICDQLQKEGLSGDVLLWWAMNGAECRLCTYFFDNDNYYAAVQSVIESVSKWEKLPAYSIVDLEKLLPHGWLASRNNLGQYEVCIDDMWKLEPVVSPRLADALALMLLHAIKAGVLKVGQLNQQLKNLLPFQKAG